MKKLLIILCIVISGSCCFATDFHTYEFSNGHTVIIKQVQNNPIVTLDTWVRTGSINETDKNSGVSHFLEHLMFKGTKKYPVGEADKLLDSKGAITNAATSKDFTHYYITIPSKSFDLALDIHSDMLLNPQIPSSELEKERKVVLEEIAKDKNSPAKLTYETLNSLIYKIHPYKRTVLGDANVIANISREAIFDYYNTYYIPSNMITIIIGDVDEDEVIKKVKVAFNTPYKKAYKNYYQKECPITESRIKENIYPTDTGYMLIGFNGVSVNNSDSYALDVLATILGDGRSSKLYQSVKEQQQLAFDISAVNLTSLDSGIFIINSKFSPVQKDRLIKSIYSELKKIQLNGVTEEDLSIAKNIITRDTHYSRESITNIATELGYTMVLTDDIKNYDGYLKKINRVSVNDVKRVANKYLQEQKSATSLTIPKLVVDNSTNKSKSSTQHNAQLVKTQGTITKYLLDNKAVLLVNKNTQNDILAITISAKGGNFIEKIAGTSSIVSNAMLKGTKNYSSLELAKVLEENGINISPRADSDCFSIEVLSTNQEIDKTIELINEIVNNATFDESELEKVRSNLISKIKEKRNIPLNKAMEEYKTYIFENSVYSNSSKIIEKTIPTIKQNDVKNYYSTIFNPENIVISVNGNVDNQKLIDAFSEIFTKKKGSEFDYSTYKQTITNRTSPKIVTTKIKDLKTSWLILGWQTSGVTNLKECATLQVIDTILGTGMSSRLFNHLREQEGLAYQVGSSYSPNVLKGAFTVYIGTNPKTVEHSRKKIMHEISVLKNQFVSDKELSDAKEQILGNYLIGLETNLSKAYALGKYEATGRGFEFINNYPTLINSVTASDIIEVANKYFNNNYVESLVDIEK